jgi:hypothetical protein
MITVLIIKRPFVIMSSWLILFIYFLLLSWWFLFSFLTTGDCVRPGRTSWQYQADDLICYELLLSAMDVCVDYVFRNRSDLTRYSSHYTTGCKWESSSWVMSIHGDVDTGSVTSCKQLRCSSWRKANSERRELLGQQFVTMEWSWLL